MSRFIHKIEYVPRYYHRADQALESPARDTLKRMELEGWELCAVGGPDSVGVRQFFFKKPSDEISSSGSTTTQA